MAEYIDRERLKQCFHANICGGNAYDELIDMQPTADVIERSKIDKAINKLKQYSESFVYAGRRELVVTVDNCIDILKRIIGE